MSAIEQCRTAALGGHVLRCDGCATELVSYNSCRNRHCPRCQSAAAKRWLDARQADLLPVEYYHVVFTLPAPIADLAYQNKAELYGLLFDVAAEVLQTIAADRKHLGARIGATLVLHTWGSALTHHPHVHGIVPGGGLAPDSKSWVARPVGFFLPVRVLSRLMRRRFIEELLRLHQSGRLRFFGELAPLACRSWSSSRCPNPHSVCALNTCVGVLRGFLPRGLYDTCPQVGGACRSGSVPGRYPTTLNNCSHLPMSAIKSPIANHCSW